MKSAVQKGFTLIEFMIVVAIIGILAAIAIPAYQDYTARAQMSEAITLAGGAKTAVAEVWQTTGDWPTTNASAGLDAAANINGEYVAQVAVAGNGVITATMRGVAPVLNDIRGQTLTMTPTDQGGSISWGCVASVPRLAPSACQ